MYTFIPIINSSMFLLDIGGAIKDFFSDLIENYVFAIFYYIEIALLYAMKLIENMMMIFTGESPVMYNGQKDTLINIFFSHDSVRGVYIGIGMVGVIFAFGFAIISVVRKMFDSRGKYQSLTMGAILGNLLKSILLIVGMNAILYASILTTNVLLQAITDSFTLSKELAKGETSKTFNEEEYAAMGRILNTIGNYSLNPSYRSRYNLNACYNDIRTDLKYLGDRGVFNFHYEEYDENENEVVTWQSLMEELGTAYDYNKETTLDSYDDGITNAILDAMEIIKANPNIKVLKSVERKSEEYKGRISIDRILFLAGTMGTINTAAARNDEYNKNPDFYDNIRAPFYYGSKDIYSFSDVKKVFSLSPLKMNYVIVYLAGYFIAMEMMLVIVTCGVRIFNLLALYLIAPLAIATMPMDDGAKFKQWTTAFVVQLLSVLGMVISIRLFLLLIPIIWSPALAINTLIDWDTDLTKLSLVDIATQILNLILTVILKIILTYTAVQAISKVNGIFTGILADNAGMQAITAGDMRQAFGETGIGKFMNAHKPFGGSQKQSEQKKPVSGGGKGEGGEGGESGGKGMVTSGMKKAAANVAKIAGAKGQGGNAQAGDAKRNKDMKMLDAAVKHGQETGRRMDGKKLSKDGKDLAIMKGTLDHMQKDGMNMKDAKAAAEKDYKAQKQQSDAAARFHQKELKAGPPNRDKAQKQASKMKDHDYKAMKRDLAFMKENGYHANGDAIKPGERGQMEETLKAYEGMHGGSGGKKGAGSMPKSQGSQVGGKASGGKGAAGTAAAAGNAVGSAAKTVGSAAGSAAKGAGNAAGSAAKSAGNAAGSAAKSAGSTAGAAAKGVGGAAGAAVGAGSIPGKQNSQVGGSTGSSSGKQDSQAGGSTGSAESTGAAGSNNAGSMEGSTGNSGGSTGDAGSIPKNQNSQIGGDGSDDSESAQDTGSIPDNQSSQISGDGSDDSESAQDTGSIPDNQSSQIGGGSSDDSGSTQDTGSIPDNQNSQIGGSSSDDSGSAQDTGSIPDNQSSQIGGGSSSSSGYSMSPEEQQEYEGWQQFMKDAFGDVDDGSSTFDRNAYFEQYRQSIPGRGNQSNQVGGGNTGNSNAGSMPTSQTNQVSGNSNVGSTPHNQSRQVGGNEDIPDNIDTSNSIND